MIITATPNDQGIFTALRTVLLGVLPNGDAIFAASISGDIMTVSDVTEGTIVLGDAVLGDNVYPGTVVAEFNSGTGGVGTYRVSPPQGSIDVPAATLSTGAEVIQSQVDRVPEPKVADYTTMTVLRFPRLGTNIETYFDVVFQGAIAGTTMTVDTLVQGDLTIGSAVFGVGVSDGTTIRAPGTGTGGPGTYFVAPAQSVPDGTTMAAGVTTLMQPAQWVIQLDVHGPNSANFAQIISTYFRSGYAVDAFTAIEPAISPLFADDPRQMPFINSEKDYENRYVIEVNLQVNQTMSIPQQSASAVTVGLYNVDFPPPSTP